MQNDQIYSEILNLVSTRDDLNLMNRELDLLEEGMYETKGNTFDFVLKKQISSDFASLISKLIEVEEKEKVIKNIREKLRRVKFAELTLSFSPSFEFMKQISNWFSSVINDQKIAIDIKIDPTMIGGARVIFNGRYFDGSIRSKLDQVLKKYE